MSTYAILGRDAECQNPRLTLVRAWFDRVSLYHWDGSDLQEIQRDVPRSVAAALAADPADLDLLYEGL